MATKFGINKDMIKNWEDRSIVLKGNNEVAVILIHGWSAFPRQMLDLGRRLNEEGYWIYIPLLSGHGCRPESLEKVIMDDWVNDVEKVLAKIKDNSAVKKVFIGGNSMGGSLAILGSLKDNFSGLILLGTPVHIKRHFLVWFLSNLLSPFGIYLKKTYPKNIKDDYPGSNSYQYFPVKSVSQCLAVIKKAAFSLGKVNTPTLILQTNSDYMVTKYSPWIIYNMVKSKIKKLHWIQSKFDNHSMAGDEIVEASLVIKRFIFEVLNREKQK
jgi:carboxylesterase